MVRGNHQGCCITKSAKEKNCGLQLDAASSTSLAIIHGTRYQKAHDFTDKLCDRILFCGQHDFFVAAVELKGGKNVHMSEAIEQIQNGLSVAKDILGSRPVAEWFPLLLYSGSMASYETKLLQTKSVEFRGERKNVIKRDCGIRLSVVLSS